eukprot:1284679-Rhodomonas_salina.1
MLGADAQGNLSVSVKADARRESDTRVVFDIGPGLCAYRFEVKGGFLLGAGSTDTAGMDEGPGDTAREPPVEQPRDTADDQDGPPDAARGTDLVSLISLYERPPE